MTCGHTCIVRPHHQGAPFMATSALLRTLAELDCIATPHLLRALVSVYRSRDYMLDILGGTYNCFPWTALAPTVRRANVHCSTASYHLLSPLSLSCRSTHRLTPCEPTAVAVHGTVLNTGSSHTLTVFFECECVAFLHLNRLGTNCEDLPQVVLESPAERDSTLPT